MSNGNTYNYLFSKNIQKRVSITFKDDNNQWVTLGNSDIVSEQMSLEDNLCSEENIRYGACESACFKVQLVSDYRLEGRMIGVQINLTDEVGRLVDDQGNYIVDADGNYIIYHDNTGVDTGFFLGQFVVVSDKPVADRSWRDITAYDYMYLLNNTDVADWYNNLTFPMTIKQLRDSLFTYLATVGNFYQNGYATLVNDSLSIKGGFTVDGQLSAKVVLEAICELNGVFGHFTTMQGDPVFDYYSIDTGTQYEPDWYIDGSGSYENYTITQLSGIVARDSEGEVGTMVGTNDNPYVIENNPLIYGIEGTTALSDALTDLLTKIGTEVAYRPFSVETYGNPAVKIGDAIKIGTKNQTINSNVINRNLTGIQSMKDNYMATGDVIRPSSVNSMSSSITRTQGKVHILTNTVNELSSEIYDQTTGILSRISQLAGEIVLKVDNNGNLVEVSLSADPSTGSTFQVSADNIDFIANNVMQFTTGVLGISADNFSIDPTTGAVAINGNITAKSGTIGGFTISSSKPADADNTSANGGHYYANSLWVHVTDSTNTYEYEVGIEGGNRSTTSRTFYVIRIPYGATWTAANVEDIFVVRKDGKLIAQNTEVGKLTFTDKLVYNSSYNTSLLPGNYDFIVPYAASYGQGIHIRNLRGDNAIRLPLLGDSTFEGYVGALLGAWKISGRSVKAEMTGTTETSYWRIIPEVDGSGVTNLGKFLKFFNSDGNVSSSTFALTNNGNNTMVASGTITQGSSRKIKENIEDIPIEEAEKILELKPVRFDYIEGAKDRRGFIAEDVAEVLPNLVTPEEEDIPASLDYNGIIPYLVKMVQKQQEEINELKSIIEKIGG